MNPIHARQTGRANLVRSVLWSVGGWVRLRFHAAAACARNQHRAEPLTKVPVRGRESGGTAGLAMTRDDGSSE